jgi:hypothetical protein
MPVFFRRAPIMRYGRSTLAKAEARQKASDGVAEIAKRSGCRRSFELCKADIVAIDLPRGTDVCQTQRAVGLRARDATQGTGYRRGAAVRAGLVIIGPTPPRRTKPQNAIAPRRWRAAPIQQALPVTLA